MRRSLFVAFGAAVALFCVLSACPIGTSYSSPDGISITVEGPVFRPLLQVSADAIVRIDWGDGSAVETVDVPFSPEGEPVVTHDGATATRTLSRAFEHHYSTEGPRDVTLLVTPWTALTVLNLGFRAGDGGNDYAMTDVPVIAYNPPLDDEAGSGFSQPWDTLSDEQLRGYIGTVTGIRNLQRASALEAVCCERQALEDLDCSGLSSLRTLEAFLSQVKSVSLQDCTSLRRCCLESTGANASWRIEAGERVEDSSLDLRDCPLLQDIRGTGDDNTLLRIHPDALSTIWHLCKMGNGRMRYVQVGDTAPAPLVVSSWTALYQCWISGSPVLTSFDASGDELGSVWADFCGITTIRLAAPHLGDATFVGNPVGSLEVEDVSQLNRLDLSGCGLNAEMVDSILAAFTESRPEAVENEDWDEDGFGDLYRIRMGNNQYSSYQNEAPSTTGQENAEILRTRGWVVDLAE